LKLPATTIRSSITISLWWGELYVEPVELETSAN
jgi:hypothetical protein